MSHAPCRHTVSKNTRSLLAALHNQLRRYIRIYIYKNKKKSKQSTNNHTYPYIRGPSTSCNAYISQPSLGEPIRGNDIRGTMRFDGAGPQPKLPTRREGESISLREALLHRGVFRCSSRGIWEPGSFLKTGLYSISTFSFFSLLALFVEF